MDLVQALIVTIIVEFLILYLFIKNSPFKLFIYSVLINSLTLPLATYAYLNLLSNIFIVELSVIFVEGLLLMVLLEMDYKKAFLISLIANSVTAITGLA